MLFKELELGNKFRTVPNSDILIKVKPSEEIDEGGSRFSWKFNAIIIQKKDYHLGTSKMIGSDVPVELVTESKADKEGYKKFTKTEIQRFIKYAWSLENQDRPETEQDSYIRNRLTQIFNKKESDKNNKLKEILDIANERDESRLKFSNDFGKLSDSLYLKLMSIKAIINKEESKDNFTKRHEYYEGNLPLSKSDKLP